MDAHGQIHHEFAACGPNELWLTDITEHQTGEGKLYMCCVKDVFSNRIVGYSIASRMKSRLTVDALNNAVAMRGDVSGCIVHSDRGSQFPIEEIPEGSRPSSSRRIDGQGRVLFGQRRRGVPFFSLVQKNVLNRRVWTTREQLRIALVTWIEGPYHRRRTQTHLDRLTPIEYETIMIPAAITTA